MEEMEEKVDKMGKAQKEQVINKILYFSWHYIIKYRMLHFKNLRVI